MSSQCTDSSGATAAPQSRAARNIKADIELVRVEDVNRAWERVVKKDVRYRFVIDMASLKASA